MKTFLVRIYDGPEATSSFQDKAITGAIKRLNGFRAYASRGFIVKVEILRNFDVKVRNIKYNEFESRMVVNEVESLQACYEMKSRRCSLDDDVDSFLENYYVDFFQKSVIEKIEERILGSTSS